MKRMSTRLDASERKSNPRRAIQPTDREQRLWAAYHADRTVDRRNAIVELHLDSAYAIARRQAGRLVCKLDPDDVRSETHIELLKCVERYNSTMDVPFVLFLRRRIVGMVRDLARKSGSETRASWRAANHAERNPDADTPRERRYRRPVLLSDPAYRSVIRSLRSAPQNPDRDGWFRRLTRGCSIKGRMVLFLYFYRDYTLASIAGILGCSESRVCQILKDTLEFLREHRDRCQVMDDYAFRDDEALPN